MYDIAVTSDEYLAFSGIESGALPSDISTKINTALVVVYSFVKHNFIQSKESHVTAVKNACMSQVLSWYENESSINEEQGGSYSFGNISVSNSSQSDSSGKKDLLCALSRMYLNNEGLLYRGVVNRCTNTQ